MIMMTARTSLELLVCLIGLQFAPSGAILGYDCGGTAANITTISLLKVGDCDLPSVQPTSVSTTVQLLQLSDYEQSSVIQCRIEIDRSIFYCGYKLMKTEHPKLFILEASKDRVFTKRKLSVNNYKGYFYIRKFKIYIC